MADKETDYKQLAEKMGVPAEDIPEPETAQPEDVAEIEEVSY